MQGKKACGHGTCEVPPRDLRKSQIFKWRPVFLPRNKRAGTREGGEHLPPGLHMEESPRLTLADKGLSPTGTMKGDSKAVGFIPNPLEEKKGRLVGRQPH